MFSKRRKLLNATVFVNANGIQEYWHVATKIGMVLSRHSYDGHDRYVLSTLHESTRWLDEDKTKAKIELENITEEQFEYVQAMKEVFATSRTV